MTTTTIEPRSRSSLAEAVDFGFGPHRGHPDGPVVRVALFAATVEAWRPWRT